MSPANLLLLLLYGPAFLLIRARINNNVSDEVYVRIHMLQLSRTLASRSVAPTAKHDGRHCSSRAAQDLSVW